jgi:hypothetical protein
VVVGGADRIAVGQFMRWRDVCCEGREVGRYGRGNPVRAETRPAACHIQSTPGMP